jgi:hypothetical protein
MQKMQEVEVVLTLDSLSEQCSDCGGRTTLQSGTTYNAISAQVLGFSLAGSQHKEYQILMGLDNVPSILDPANCRGTPF